MSLDTFDFPYHTFLTNNPDTSVRVQLGGGYVFTAEPSAPDQRLFTLNFPCMKWFTNTDNVTVNNSDSPKLNMKKLSEFYQAHKLYLSFNYVHPVYGTLEVKFNKPLQEPEGIPGGNGAVKPFTIELIEVV